jgi:DNA-binding NarL/FixJ family response regulator
MSTLREQESIRIMVIDEEHLVRASLKALVTSWEGFQVVGEAASKREAVKQLDRLELDVVLLSLRGSNEVESRTVHDIAQVCGSARLLVLIPDDHQEFRSQLLRLGTRVLLKTQDPIEVQRTIQTIYATTRGQPASVRP